MLEKVVVALGHQAEPSLAALEARESSSREKVTLNLLRPFGRLITSKGRDLGAALLLDPAMTVGRLKSGLNVAVRQMWVDCHWRAGNPHLDADKGVPLWCSSSEFRFHGLLALIIHALTE